jgi:hypothetical protein
VDDLSWEGRDHANVDIVAIRLFFWREHGGIVVLVEVALRGERKLNQRTELSAWHGFSSIAGPMANPQIDQFMHALIWKALPVIFVASIAGLLLKEALQWLERKATRIGRSRQAQRDARASATTQNLSTSTATPHCPIDNALMVKRTAKRGTRAGSWFWGCPNYPKCRGTRAF